MSRQSEPAGEMPASPGQPDARALENPVPGTDAESSSETVIILAANTISKVCPPTVPIERPFSDYSSMTQMTSVEQKTYWSLLETVRWICTRDDGRVAVMWDIDEYQGIALAMFGAKQELDPRSLLFFRKADPDSDREAAGLSSESKSSRTDASLVMGPGEALCDLRKKVQSGRIWMTGIRCDGSCNEPIQIPPAELNDLSFRLSPGHQVALVGLWSRSRRIWAWKSPQFLRADVIRIWPARSTKTAAVSGAILRHLQRINTPEAPLTKREAQQRCMTEVPRAYAEAFRNAWAKLESSCKRGRGKHGPRAH